MKNSHFIKQDDGNSAAFALADFSAQFVEKCFNIFPLDVGAGWMGQDQFKSALVLPLHAFYGTAKEYQRKTCCPST